MNYKDLIGITTESNSVIAYIPNVVKLKKQMYMRDDYRCLYIYSFISNEQAICGYKNGSRDIYNIKTIDNSNWLCLNNEGKEEKIANLDDMVLTFVLVGEIDENNKIHSEYFNQGSIYKNEIAYLRTKDLSKEELEKLPLKDKICYIPEGAFDNKDCIDLNLNNLEDGVDYYTIDGIKKDIRTALRQEEYYYRYQKEGKPYVIEAGNFDEKLIGQIADYVFNEVDWQYPSSLISETDWSEDIKTYYDNKISNLGADYGL